jgi:hypothetical protein
MGKSNDELYQERLQRVKDVVALKVPDLVPIVSPVQAFTYWYAGVTLKDAMYDYEVARNAARKFCLDFQPDLDFGPVLMYPAKVMDILGLQWFRWPGHGISENAMYQFIEGEYMKEDEYDEFIYDPGHFMMTKWIPRSFGNLAGLSEFPAMRGSMWYGWLGTLPPFAGCPNLWNALETLKKAGEEINRWFASLDQYKQEIKEEGFPISYGGWAFAPFDLLGDTLRGVRGIFPDMIQQPDKLLEAVEKMVPIAIEGGSVAAEANDPPMAWIWLHKGSDEFMSVEQFKTFYWPSLKALICGLIDNGVIPVVYGEGNETSRLEHYTEIPKGKAIFHFATTDIFKAKDVLKDVCCISGNLPNSLMVAGTPDDVKAYCKKLIDYCGKDGGYIMDTSALLDEAKPENVRAMFEFTREYGVYR